MGTFRLAAGAQEVGGGVGRGSVVGVVHRKPDHFLLGLAVSLAAHGVLAIMLVVKIAGDFGELPEPIVYSISIEGGKSLGGVSQIPKPDQKQPVAPPKNVRNEEPEVQQERREEPPEKAADRRDEPEVDDAEVSVAESRPTPVPARPTPAPQPSARPTPRSTARPTAVPTAVPKKDERRKTPEKSTGEDVDKRLQAALQRYLGESSESKGQGFGAARVGGAGMGGGVVRPPEFFAYQKIIKARIKEGWRWYDVQAALITQVSFDIEPNGEIRNVRVVKSSGDSSFDESVQRAVVKASPLPAPPASVYEQFFKSVRIAFDPRE
jgi:TonB family protein